MFIEDKVYRRQDLHSLYGGQERGGISTPSQFPIIFLFTGSSGKEYGYSDHWADEGTFLYTGEGQNGPMKFEKGNRAILNHEKDGKQIYLFEYVRTGYVRLIGKMACTGYQIEQMPDKSDDTRDAIVFRLTLLSLDSTLPVQAALKTPASLRKLSLAKLRQKALEAASNVTEIRERKALFRNRSLAIKLYALRRSEGICGGCKKPAPFIAQSGEPFLEVHHLNRLSDGGLDRPEAVIAICPNCHRRAHLAEDAAWFNEQLRIVVLEQEKRVDA